MDLLESIPHIVYGLIGGLIAAAVTAMFSSLSPWIIERIVRIYRVTRPGIAFVLVLSVVVAAMQIYYTSAAITSLQSRVSESTSVNVQTGVINLDHSKIPQLKTLTDEQKRCREFQPRGKIAERETFEKPFVSEPEVFLALSTLDTDKDTNLRVKIIFENADYEGFNYTIFTWCDSLVDEIEVSWIAVGR